MEGNGQGSDGAHDQHVLDRRSTPGTPGLVVCGTGSGVGKSVIVAGLCRSLARQGIHVAPFKAQNMSNNSSVTVDHGEIGRAQYAQARAAGVQPTTAMNPVLLKPTADRMCDVIVRGHLAGRSSASDYGAWTPRLRREALAAFADLAAEHDVVLCEGAGGAAEINLLHRDIVNLPFAHATGLPAVIVADIERGGAFSGLFGVWSILPEDLRSTIGGFVINRFRGDPSLLRSGIDELGQRTGVPVLGVLPWIDGIMFDEEDSQFLVESHPERVDIDVAAVRLPRVANTSDLDPIASEPGVRVRWVQRPAELGQPDLIVLPGSKNTAGDLAWLRDTGLAEAIVASPAVIMGICAGYQMLGDRIDDDVESHLGAVEGLGLLPVATAFAHDKIVRRRRGSADGAALQGYEIRHGRPTVHGGNPWLVLDDAHGQEREGCVGSDRRVFGTSLHGLFECDDFRRAFLAEVSPACVHRASLATMVYEDVLRARADLLADHLEAHLDLASLWSLAGISADVSSTLPAGQG